MVSIALDAYPAPTMKIHPWPPLHHLHRPSKPDNRRAKNSIQPALIPAAIIRIKTRTSTQARIAGLRIFPFVGAFMHMAPRI